MARKTSLKHRRPSLAVSIIWRFVLYATLPVIIGGGCTLYLFTKKNIRDIKAKSTFHAHTVVKEVEYTLQEPVIVLKTLSPILHDSIFHAPSAAYAVMSDIIRQSTFFESIFAVDRASGTPIGICRDRNRPCDSSKITVFIDDVCRWSGGSASQVYWSPPLPSSVNGEISTIVALADDQRVIAGVCAIGFLQQHLDSISRVNGVAITVVDSTGYTLFESSGESDSVYGTAHMRPPHLLRNDTTYTYSENGNDYIVSVHLLRHQGWRIVVTQSVRAAYAPIFQLTLVFMCILMALVVLSAGGGWVSARWLSRLFSFLGNNARRIADGDYHAKMPDQDHYELEALAENIRSMVTAVRMREEQYRDLNQETRRNLLFQRALLEAINIPVVYYNLHGDILGCNSMFESAMGVTRDRIVHLVDSREAPRPLRQLMEMIKVTGETAAKAFERSVLFSDHRFHTVIIHRAPFYLDEGKIGGYICALLDITEHRMTEDAFQRLIQSTVGVHGVDFFHRIVRLLCDWIGCDGAIIGEITSEQECRGLSMVMNGLRVDEYTFGLDNSPARKAIDEGFFFIEDDVGVIFPLDTEMKRLAIRGYAGVSLEADNGTKLGVLALLSRTPLRLPPMARGSMEILASLAASEFLRMRAQREQVKLETQLRQVEKMEAIGQLAGGIAHDINNQLGCILGYSDIIQDVNKEPVIAEFIRKISQAVSRSADLVRKLLAFSRHGNCIMKPVNMSTLIHEVVGLLQHSVDKSIVLSMVAADGQQFVMGDPSQLQNALLNLGLNARDALLEGGTITYEVHAMHVGPEEEKRFPTLAEGEYVSVQVRDDGVGIPSEIIDRIFEPFFTTKAEGKGTGLGLAAVYGTISSHRGAIDVRSRMGEGTVFTILLPLYTAPVDEVVEEKDEPPPFGSGTILVIDDEIDIRDSVAIVLRKCGFTVLTAGDGLEGVQIYLKYFGRIDLVVLDMVMPGMDGKSTFERLMEVDPVVKVIIVSGYSVDGRVQAVLDRGARSFLQKPFRTADLLRMVADVLKN